jgi:ubiquinone/menaquinone biosynthesis C-methylase UbiE
VIPARVFAAAYDRMMAAAEHAGMRERRRELIAQARGRVLEIGAGTGLNVDHYGEAVTDLVFAEPEGPMAKRLRARVVMGKVVEAPAEQLPFADDSFDTVVATLVLCTVEDTEQALAEIRRVLAPGGRLLLLEHVRSHDPGLAKWQDRLERPWHWVGRGCHCNRDTANDLAAAGFDVSVETMRIPKAAPLVKPAIVGSATPRAQVTAPSGHPPA